MQQKLADMAQKKKLPRLENLGQDWSRLDTEHAQVAYALSLAAVEQFFQNYAQFGIGEPDPQSRASANDHGGSRQAAGL